MENTTENDRKPDERAGCAVADLFGVWVPVAERLPEHGCKVLACYLGVYGPRVTTFWRDGGGNAHFGYPDSHPATHWMPLPSLPSPNAGTQRPGTPDGSLATETRKPGSLK